MITGASSGLGEAFARRLAGMSYDLVLVARREDRLRALAAELSPKFGVRAETFPADLAADAGIASVEERLSAGDEWTLLVNNAGFGSGGFYYRTDAVKMADMVHVHVAATAGLTRAVLPGLVERGRGAVINVASVAAFTLLPTSAMYSSTKAWMVAFSRILAAELKGTGVRVQALCPGFTHTGFHDTPEFEGFRETIPKFLWIKADDVVVRSLEALSRGRTVYIPGAKNKLMRAVTKVPFAWALTARTARKRG